MLVTSAENIGFDLQPMCNTTKLFTSFYLKSVRKGYDDKDMIPIDMGVVKHGQQSVDERTNNTSTK
jgi:hypothetical protein